MPGERFESLLADHLDGTLGAAEREELAAEVERDPAAAAAFDRALRIEALLVAAHAEGPSEAALAGRIDGRAAPASPLPGRAAWRSRALAAAAAAILIAAGAWAARGLRPGSAPAPAPAAPNQVLAGRVLVDGTESSAIANGASVEVLGDEPAEVRLADGSRASLAPGSRAVLRGPVGAVRQVVELGSGQGSFEVEKEPRQFRVETAAGSVTVLGTKFSVELLPADRKGDAEMKGKLGLALAVTVMAGTVQVNHQGREATLTVGMGRVVFGEEGAKDGPREGALRDGESIVGRKLTVSEKPAAATFSGVVLGREKAVLKVRIEKVEGQTEWTGPKNEAGKTLGGKVAVGEPLAICAQWEKGEGDKWRPARAEMRIFELLRPGDKVEGGIYFDEHPRMSYVTVTARTGNAERDGERQREGDKRDGERKKEGDRPKEKPKGGDEF